MRRAWRWVLGLDWAVWAVGLIVLALGLCGWVAYGG